MAGGIIKMLHWDAAFGGLWDTIVSDFEVAPHGIFIVLAWFFLIGLWLKDNDTPLFKLALRVIGILLIMGFAYVVSETLLYAIFAITFLVLLYCVIAR